VLNSIPSGAHDELGTEMKEALSTLCSSKPFGLQQNIETLSYSAIGGTGLSIHFLIVPNFFLTR